MKYLVAVRNSPCSEAMFQKLVGLVDKERDLLFFCCVIPKASHSDSAEKERLALQYRERANDLISSYRIRAQELGIRHTGTVLVGDARSVLLEHVKKVHADCLVMGRRKDRPLLGGVSSYVAVNCPCSVMVLKTENTDESRRSLSIDLRESDRDGGTFPAVAAPIPLVMPVETTELTAATATVTTNAATTTTTTTTTTNSGTTTTATTATATVVDSSATVTTTDAPAS